MVTSWTCGAVIIGTLLHLSTQEHIPWSSVGMAEEKGSTIASSLESLMKSYVNSRMGYYNSYDDGDSSTAVVLLCLALGIPLILTLLPLLLGPLMALLGLTGLAGATGGIPTVTPGVAIIGRRRREVS